jgi:hypothetical protein
VSVRLEETDGVDAVSIDGHPDGTTERGIS